MVSACRRFDLVFMMEREEELPTVRGYDRIAKVYRFLEWTLFRGALQRARVSLLSEVPNCRKMLLLGDGDGRFLKQFVISQPCCSVVSVDLSVEMLKLQANEVRKVGDQFCVDWVCCDVRELDFPEACFDGVSTVFFLDCFTPDEISVLLPQIMRWIRPGGVIHFVEFQLPAKGWRRFRGVFYLGLMHLFFRWQTGLQNRQVQNFDEVFRELPVTLIAGRSSNYGLIRSSLYRLK